MTPLTENELEIMDRRPAYFDVHRLVAEVRRLQDGFRRLRPLVSNDSWAAQVIDGLYPPAHAVLGEKEEPQP